MDYTRDTAYFSFLIESAEEERRLINAINESFIVCEGTNIVPKIAALHEGQLLDGAKAKLDKFIEFLKKLWNKFIENMNSVFLSGVKYLEKYKDVILNRKPVDGEWEVKRYDIGLERIAADPIIAFTPDLLTSGLLDSEEAFQKKLLSKSEFHGTEDFATYCKDYFTGGADEVKMQANQLNFTDMYNFCHDKKAIYDNIQKDYTAVTNGTNVAYTYIKQEINKIEQEQRKAQAAANQQATKDAANQNAQNAAQQPTPDGAEAKPPAQPPAQTQAQPQGVKVQPVKVRPQAPQPVKVQPQKPVPNNVVQFPQQRQPVKVQPVKVHQSGAIYSDLYDSYIIEAPTRTKTDASSSTPGISQGANGTLTQATRSNIALANPNIGTDGMDAAADQIINGGEGTGEERLKEISAKIDIYNKCCRTFLAAKMTAIDSAYNDYMYIIKTHVRDQLGQASDAKKTGNQMAQAGTEYQTGSQLPTANAQ